MSKEALKKFGVIVDPTEFQKYVSVWINKYMKEKGLKDFKEGLCFAVAYDNGVLVVENETGDIECSLYHGDVYRSANDIDKVMDLIKCVGNEE